MGGSRRIASYQHKHVVSRCTTPQKLLANCAPQLANHACLRAWANSVLFCCCQVGAAQRCSSGVTSVAKSFQLLFCAVHSKVARNVPSLSTTDLFWRLARPTPGTSPASAHRHRNARAGRRSQGSDAWTERRKDRWWCTRDFIHLADRILDDACEHRAWRRPWRGEGRARRRGDEAARRRDGEAGETRGAAWRGESVGGGALSVA